MRHDHENLHALHQVSSPTALNQLLTNFQLNCKQIRPHMEERGNRRVWVGDEMDSEVVNPQSNPSKVKAWFLLPNLLFPTR